MSGNCKDCQYWRHHVDGYGAAWNECEGVDSTGLEDPVLNADFAIYAEAHDTSGLQVGLKTGPMFGCVQFKLNTEKNGEQK